MPSQPVLNETEATVRRIAALQSLGRGPFPAGLFPNWRYHATLPYRRADTNVFCTAITVFTLNGIRADLTPAARQVVDDIARNARQAYPAYRNPTGRPTYNNYETRPGGHFQTGYVFHRFRHFRLPDDIDDTALVMLTQPPAREDLLRLKELLPRHANGTRRRVVNAPPEYRDLPAYSTWFGERMGIDLDVCALCNLLLLIFGENLPLNGWDEASLAFIRRVVLSDDYRRRPFDVSHHYPRPALIFYHVSRLLAAHDPAQLAGCRQKLLADGPALLRETPDFFDAVLLKTSLKKLGATVPSLIKPVDFEQQLSRHPFFVGCMLTPFERPRLLYHWAHHPFTHFRWNCPAHALALWAEYLILMEN